MKSGFVEQVAGRVAGQRQLGKNHHLRLLGMRLRGCATHQGDVAVDVADRRIQLREGDAKGVHGVSSG
jgi:hypothetical protein